MRLLVGLGNPGETYAGHRHNVGFMAVDAIAEAHGFGPERVKFHARVREGAFDSPGGRFKALILKPQTYMNESGRAVGEAMRFFKLSPADIVVFYDELDLAPGKIRVKTGGGAAGHNGVRSMVNHIGAEFERVRIGIGHPGDKSRVLGHVLSDFAKADQVWLGPLLDAIARRAPLIAAGDGAGFMSQVANDVRAESQARARPQAKAARSAAPDPAQNNEPQDGPLADGLRGLLRRRTD